MHGHRDRPHRGDGARPKIAAHREWADDALWVLAHWDDVLSDFSVLHRLDEDAVNRLTPREFFPRASRLVHYQGATRDVALIDYRKAQASGTDTTPSQPAAPEQPAPTTGELVDPTPDQIRALRDAARRKRFPADKFGDVSYVSTDEIVKEASRGA